MQVVALYVCSKPAEADQLHLNSGVSERKFRSGGKEFFFLPSLREVFPQKSHLLLFFPLASLQLLFAASIAALQPCSCRCHSTISFRHNSDTSQSTFSGSTFPTLQKT